MTAIYAIVAVLLGAYVLRVRKPLAIVAYTALVASATLATVQLMGVPKPMWTELRDMDANVVIAAEIHPGVAIYVWLRGDPPIAYELPWSEDLARDLQEGLRNAKEAGLDGVHIKQGDSAYTVEGIRIDVGPADRPKP
jgi:hypothetical protein